jgi:predicted GNAT family acetyltransferase
MCAPSQNREESTRESEKTQRVDTTQAAVSRTSFERNNYVDRTLCRIFRSLFSSLPLTLAMSMSYSVTHDSEHHRFIVMQAGSKDTPQTSTGAYLEYHLSDDDHVADFAHTFTPAAQRGKGLAAIATNYAFEYARKQGWKVIPSCTYVAETFLPKNPQHADLIKQ